MMTRATTNEAPGAKAGRREWIGLAVIALPCLLYSMDLTVLHLAVPSLTADLQPTAAQLLWIVDIYGFLIAGLLVTMGTLGDRIGRRRLLMIGAVAFGVTSVIAAFSTSPGMLIAARAMLGIAGATLAPSTLSLIRNMFLDEKERTFAVGIWAASFSVGAGIGPLVGGILLQYFWWGSVFLIAVPVMVLLLAAAPRFLPEFRDPQAGRIDLFSALLSLSAVLMIIYAVKQFAEGHGGWQPAALVLGGLAVGALFVRRQFTLPYPLIDVQLFRIPTFRGAVLTNMLTTFAAFGTFLFVAQYFQLVVGLSPLQAGLWTLPSSAGFIIGSLAAPAIVARFDRNWVITGGLALAAIGIAALALVTVIPPMVAIVGGSLTYALGLAAVATLTTDLIIGSAPPERAGSASSVSETAAELGGALGIAFLGSLGAAVYRASMAGDIPAGIPAEAAEAAEATLGGAAAVAAQLPEPAAAALLDAGRDAFTNALQASALLSTLVVIGLAFLAFRLVSSRNPAAS